VSRILLDTHIFLLCLADPSKLSAGARRRIEEADVFVSAVSIWEVSIKAALKKISADPLELLTEIDPAGFKLLAITGEHAAAVATLPAVHADPFDRMLVAQAKTEPLLLLTNDSALAAYGDCVELVPPKSRR